MIGMMHSLRFDKMHGLGNDFIIVDSRTQSAAMDSGLARALADRKTGIGCDQLVYLSRSDRADLSMRIFNHDGSEVEACGNASRCVVAREGRDCSIETKGGIIHGRIAGSLISVDMGQPRFQWNEIPLDHPVDAAHLPIAWEPLSGGMCVNVGNPHVVFFAVDLDTLDLAALGPLIEHDPLFPERVNVNFAQIIDQQNIRLIVWERGVGFTQACGTGACATAVAAISRKLTDSPVNVHLPSGALHISWQQGASILMQGPATFVYSGEIDLNALNIGTA